MLNVSFNIEKGQLEKFDFLKKDLKKAFKKAMQSAMLFAEKKSKDRFNTPGNLKVQTGTLRRSIKGIVEEDMKRIKGILFTNVEYGPPHELGLMMKTRSGSTYMMPKRPFLQPAITENLNEMNKIVVNDVMRFLEK